MLNTEKTINQLNIPEKIKIDNKSNENPEDSLFITSDNNKTQSPSSPRIVNLTDSITSHKEIQTVSSIELTLQQDHLVSLLNDLTGSTSFDEFKTLQLNQNDLDTCLYFANLTTELLPHLPKTDRTKFCQEFIKDMTSFLKALSNKPQDHKNLQMIEKTMSQKLLIVSSYSANENIHSIINSEIRSQLSHKIFSNKEIDPTSIKQKGLGSCLLMALLNTARKTHAQCAIVKQVEDEAMIIFHNSKWQPSQQEIDKISHAGYEVLLSPEQVVTGVKLNNDLITRLNQDDKLATANTLDDSLLAKVTEDLFAALLPNRHDAYNAVVHQAASLFGLNVETFKAKSIMDIITITNLGKVENNKILIPVGLSLDTEGHQYNLLSYDYTTRTARLFNPWGRIEEYNITELENKFKAFGEMLICLNPEQEKIATKISATDQSYDLSTGIILTGKQKTGIYYNNGVKVTNTVTDHGIRIDHHGREFNGISNDKMYINGQVSSNYQVKSKLLNLGRPVLLDNSKNQVTGEVGGIYFEDGKQLNKTQVKAGILYDGQTGEKFQGVYKEKLYKNGKIEEGFSSRVDGMFHMSELFTGKFIDKDKSINLLYKDGKLFNGFEAGKVYLRGALLTGAYVNRKNNSIFICEKGNITESDINKLQSIFPEVAQAIKKEYSPDYSEKINKLEFMLYQNKAQHQQPEN